MFGALFDEFLQFLYLTYIRPRQIRELLLWAASYPEIRVVLTTREKSRSGNVESRFLGGKLIHQGELGEWEIHGRFLVPGGWDTIFPFHEHEVGEISFLVPEIFRTTIPADAGQFVVQVCDIGINGGEEDIQIPAITAQVSRDLSTEEDAAEDHEDAAKNGDYL